MATELPRYRDLPVNDDAPARSSWGLFGDSDQLGTINLLTPQRVEEAARLVQRGAVYSLNWEMELPDPPLFQRRRLSHQRIQLEPAGTDDYYDSYFPQSSTHWDALRHTSHLEHGEYNSSSSGPSPRTNGIEHWARRGLVGRFVLADVASHRAATDHPATPGERDEISIDELSEVLQSQQVELTGGDILLIRTGWLSWYESQPQPVREELGAADTSFPSIGLKASEKTAEWLWDQQVAAVAADNPALEATPFDESTFDGYLHYRLIALLGMAVGELFNLDHLAADCQQDRRYDGFFTSAPLNKSGGSGSPANALAIK